MKFQIFKTRSSKRTPAVQFGARLRAKNGEIVWRTETYTRKEKAQNAIDLFQKEGAWAITEDLTSA